MAKFNVGDEVYLDEECFPSLKGIKFKVFGPAIMNYFVNDPNDPCYNISCTATSGFLLQFDVRSSKMRLVEEKKMDNSHSFNVGDLVYIDDAIMLGFKDLYFTVTGYKYSGEDKFYIIRHDNPLLGISYRLEGIDGKYLTPVKNKRTYKIIAVDFDGTLCEDKFPEIGEPYQALIDYLKRAQDEGNKLILWTCREGKYLEDAISWCMKRGLVFDAYNANLPEIIAEYGRDSRKIFADIYIDDHRISTSDISLSLSDYDEDSTN